MININTVRNSVLFILNKSNRGYIGVEEFNYFCQLAQMEIFEDLFFKYNAFINKDNKRLTGTEYADLPRNLREQIDAFASYSTDFFYDEALNVWTYTGTDLYRAEGLSLVNLTTNKMIDIEEVLKSQINILNNNPNTAPSLLFPVYARIGDSNFQVSPVLPEDTHGVRLFYIRRPLDPKWTYTSVSGSPLYNAGAVDLQHFELHPSQLVPLVTKILGYAGLSIREQEVEAFSNSEEQKEFAKKQ